MAGLLLICLAAWDVHARDAYLAKYFALQRFDAAAGDPLIVAIGSSKTRCALEFDQDMERLLSRNGMQAHFIRLTRGRATIEDLKSVLARVAEARPRWVLIEADLLLYDPNIYRPEGDKARDGWRRRLQRSAAYALIGDRAYGYAEPSEKYENSPASALSGCGSGNTESVASHLEMLGSRRGSSQAELQPYLQALADIRSHGADVRMIEYPHAPQVETGFPSNLRLAAAANREHILNTGLVAEFWQATPMLPQQAFLDAGHMTSGGRAMFSTKFAARMAELARQ